MTVDLSDAWEKLRWAKHHFDGLRGQIEAFEKRESHSLRCEIDPDLGKYTFYVSGLEPFDPDWGLIIGDCVHNARSALDYVVVRLWALVTDVSPAEVDDRLIQFPISSPRLKPNASETDIEEAWSEARKSFNTFKAKCAKQPLFHGYLARIEELQPFNNGVPSIWGMENGLPRTASLPVALERLARLDNVDKHRVPHAVWASVDFFRGAAVQSIAPDGFIYYAGSVTGSPLKEDADIGEWRFQTPLPSEWEPSQMEMKRCFPLHVAFGDPSPFKGVLEILPFCLWGVEAVLKIFEPVFRPDHEPPLPVTAIAEPRD